MKTCTKCGVEKGDEEFFPRGEDHAKLRAHCKACLRRTDGQRARRRELMAKSSERHIIDGAIQRCHNPRNPSFANYGARGIAVCDRWRESPDLFLADMGPRPSRLHSLDRIDNEKGYSPDNCRWATRAEQARNTRQNAVLTIDGVSKCRTEWALESGVPASLIRDRTEVLGWSVYDAVWTPPRSQRRRRAA